MTTVAKKPATSSGKRTASTRSIARRQQFINPDGALTVKQWDALPDTKPRYELLDGKLVQKMTTTTAHAWAIGKLLFTLMTWGEPRGWVFLPEGTGVKKEPFSGAVPDVVGFAPSTQLAAKTTSYEQPFLVVEVISRRTAKTDRTRKKDLYAQIGVALYLVIDPDKKTLEVFTLQNGDYAAPRVLAANETWQPDELPGLRLETHQLWMQ